MLKINCSNRSFVGEKNSIGCTLPFILMVNEPKIIHHLWGNLNPTITERLLA